MAAKPKRRIGIVLAIVGIVVIAASIPWLLRGAIATSMARSELESKGLTCDDRFSVDVAAFFGSATLAPTTCSFSSRNGALHRVEITSPAEIELSGFSPVDIHIPSASVRLHERRTPGGSDWASQLRRLHLEERVASLVHAMRELSELDIPHTRIDVADVTRGDRSMVVLEGLELTPGQPMDLRARQARFESVSGAMRLTLEDVTGNAASSRVHLEGNASVSGQAMLMLNFTTRGTFEVDATGLDTEQPAFRLQSSL